MQSDQKWYVLVTRPRAEKQVSRRLSEIGFENFLPLQRKLRFWHDRKKWVEIPLFYSYIFVKTEDKLRSKVFEAAGLIKFVSIGGDPAILSEPEIERIKRLCSYPGDIVIEEETLCIGDDVNIIAGHFKGLQGRLLHTGGRDKLKISISGLGCMATVEIDRDVVQKSKP